MLADRKKYGFVILHYLVYEMTKECVSNLLTRFGTEDIHITVVDNASGNGSGEKLAELYRDEEKVTVLLNKTNEGFARGNNVGYRYLLDNHDPDYIIVMNNDVLVEQNEFLLLIDRVYQEEKYAVLGPDIFSPNAGIHQNPAHAKGFSLEEVSRLHANYVKVCSCPVYYFYRRRVKQFVMKKLLKKNNVPHNADYVTAAVNPVLHGACYIFSRDYFAVRDTCFNPNTFLYFEEDILHYECGCLGLKIVYSPMLQVKHLEDVSTNASIQSGLKRFAAKHRGMRDSSAVMLSLMKDER